MQPGNVTTAFVWGLLPPLLLLAGVWWIDRHEKEPIGLLAAGLGVGALVVPLIALPLEDLFDEPSSLTGQSTVPDSVLTVGTPILEEVALAIGIVITLWIVRRELDGLLDGLIYGAATGLGLDAASNFVSILQTPALGGDTTASLFSAMVGGLNQVLYGGIIGIALAVSWQSRSTFVKAVAALAGVGTAIGVHLLHDYLPWWAAASPGSAASSTWSTIADYLPNGLGLVALAAIAMWALGREALLLSYQLEDEVGRGVLQPAEYAEVTTSLRRTAALARTLFLRGPRAWWLRRRLYRFAIELAFRKYHRLSRRELLPGTLDEDDYRTAIKETRVALDAGRP